MTFSLTATGLGLLQRFSQTKKTQPSERTTCLADKHKSSSRKAESQQIAVWQLLYQVRHLGRYISRLQTIWGLHSAKWISRTGKRTSSTSPVSGVRDEGRSLSFPTQKGGPTVKSPCLGGLLPQRRSGIIPRMVASLHRSIERERVPNVRTCGSSRTEQDYYRDFKSSVG